MQDDVVTRVLELLTDEINGLAAVCHVQNAILLDILNKNTGVCLNNLETAIKTLSTVSERAAQIQTKLVFLKQGVSVN